MARIRFVVEVSGNSLAQRLDNWKAIVDKGELVCDRVAQQSLKRLIDATPIRYSGRVRGAWTHTIVSPMVHVNENRSKVMGWLERGTKAHGPKKARALFIPLNQRTADVGPRGVMAANASARNSGAMARYGAAASNNNYEAPLISYPFKFGVDFLWAKKVKGIRARRIAKNEQKEATRELRAQLSEMLKNEFT